MTTEHQKSRSARKRVLTKEFNNIERIIEERDPDEIVAERVKLKHLYRKFKQAHDLYHDPLTDTDEISTSENYYLDVSNVYTMYLRKLNAAIDLMESKEARVSSKVVTNDESVISLAQLMSLPPLKIEIFDGSPDDYDTFISTFEEVIGRVTSDPAAKLIRLKSHVTGKAADAINSCRTQDGEKAYNNALKILRERFGSPHIVCNNLESKLKTGADVRTPAELRTFADELSNAEVTLKGNDMFPEMDTQSNIVQICRRLIPQLRYKWRDHVMKKKKTTSAYLTFSDFVLYVQEQADIVNDPIYGKDALIDRSNHSLGSKKSVSSLPVATQAASKPDATLSAYDGQRQPMCCLCDRNHKLYHCFQFKDMSIDKRCVFVKDNNLCKICLSKGHTDSVCKSPYICKIYNCNKKHSSLLHMSDNRSSIAVTNNCANSYGDRNVYMPIIPVIINDTFHTHALLDTGSTNSFCSRRLANELNVTGTKISYQLQTLHGCSDRQSEVVKLKMSSIDGKESLNMNNVLLVDEIPVEHFSIDDINKYAHLKDLNLSTSNQVDVIIGQDQPSALVPIKIRRGPVGTPFATLTIMGWSLNGTSSTNVSGRRVTTNFISTSVLDEKINKLWEMEEEGIIQESLELSVDDKKVIELWDTQCEIVDDHFQLPIPWKDPDVIMPDNLNVALHRLQSLRASLGKKSMLQDYDQQINHMVAQGYAEHISGDYNERPKKCWYLPTHAVLKKDKCSLRIVFDCAHIYKGISLNGSCYQGPN